MQGHSRGSNQIAGTLLLTVVIIVILAISAFVLAKFVDVKSVVHKFIGHRVYDVKKPSDDLVKSVEPPESIDLRQMEALRSMLEDEKFYHLNMTLALYQKDFENNQMDEYKVYDQALAAANRAIELRPVRYEGYLIRARAHFALENYDDALTDVQTAEAICPGAHPIEKWRKWASEVLLSRGHKIFKTDLPGAVSNYDLAMKFDETNFELYYWRGIAYSHMGDFESALQDLAQAIEINPRHFKSYQIIDSFLAKRQQWETIIGYWDAFIELEPDNEDAYYERSGAHYHNRDFKNAIIDLKKACDLGNKSACKRFDQVKDDPKFKGLWE